MARSMTTKPDRLERRLELRITEDLEKHLISQSEVYDINISQYVRRVLENDKKNVDKKRRG